MTDAADRADAPGLVGVWVLADAAGAAVGVLGGGFRWCLECAEEWHLDLLGWAQDASPVTLLIPVLVTAAGAAVARWLVAFAPDAAGSGIQEVEAVWDRQLPPRRLGSARREPRHQLHGPRPAPTSTLHTCFRCTNTMRPRRFASGRSSTRNDGRHGTKSSQ